MHFPRAKPGHSTGHDPFGACSNRYPFPNLIVGLKSPDERSPTAYVRSNSPGQVKKHLRCQTPRALSSLAQRQLSRINIRLAHGRPSRAFTEHARRRLRRLLFAAALALPAQSPQPRPQSHRPCHPRASRHDTATTAVPLVTCRTTCCLAACSSPLYHQSAAASFAPPCSF